MTTPLHTWPETQRTPPPRFPDEGSWASPGYRSADTRATVAKITHALAALTVLGQAAVIAQVFPLLDRIDRFQATEAEIDEWLDQLGLVAIVEALVALVSFIALLTWLSRSVDNTPPLGGGVARRGPRWAIGAWFIPIVNIIMPATIIRDLARRISPELSGRGRLVLVWWLLYWGPTIVSIYIDLLPIRGTDSVRDIYVWLVATQLISAAGYLATLYMVRRLQRDADFWAGQHPGAPTPVARGGPVPGWPGTATEVPPRH